MPFFASHRSEFGQAIWRPQWLNTDQNLKTVRSDGPHPALIVVDVAEIYAGSVGRPQISKSYCLRKWGDFSAGERS